MESSTVKKQLSQDDIEYFMSILAQYEPYDLDDQRLDVFDDDSLDENRYNATVAKKVLLQAGIIEE